MNFGHSFIGFNMNYLSHFYVLPTFDDPYMTFGSIMPDLYRSFKKEMKGLDGKSALNESAEFVSLKKGISNHIVSDSLFHNLPFFKKNTLKISNQLRGESALKMNKYVFFLSHLLLEMQMDKILMENNKGLVERFYDHVRLTDDTVLTSFVRRNIMDEMTDNFVHKKNVFLSRQFLKDYHSNTFIIQAISKIFEKIKVDPISKSDQGIVEQLCETGFGSNFEREMLAVLHSLKKKTE